MRNDQTNRKHIRTCVPPKWSSRKPLAVSYELRLEAHLPGLLTNLELKLPIHIN